jgi:hypothetical protein
MVGSQRRSLKRNHLYFRTDSMTCTDAEKKNDCGQSQRFIDEADEVYG